MAHSQETKLRSPGKVGAGEQSQHKGSARINGIKVEEIEEYDEEGGSADEYGDE